MKTFTLMPLAGCLFLIVILTVLGALFLPLLLALLPIFLLLLLCRLIFGPRVIAIHRYPPPPPPSGPDCEPADTSGEAADTVIDVTAQVVDESPDTIRKIGE